MLLPCISETRCNRFPVICKLFPIVVLIHLLIMLAGAAQDADIMMWLAYVEFASSTLFLLCLSVSRCTQFLRSCRAWCYLFLSGYQYDMLVVFLLYIYS
jgi:hypothetical protein